MECLSPAREMARDNTRRARSLPTALMSWAAASTVAVQITGTGGGNGAGNDPGVWLGGAGTGVEGGAGGVVINGTDKGAGSYNWGVELAGAPEVLDPAGGSVTINGTGGGTLLGPGGAGDDADNLGVLITDPHTQVSAKVLRLRSTSRARAVAR